MDLGLRGRYALVTGGSHGIGRAIALALAGEGVHVAICARNEARLQAVVAEIERHDVRALGVAADALEVADIDRVVATIGAQWGQLHILVNNVGGGGRWGSEQIEETADEVWLDVYRKNALSAALFTARLLPHLRRARWGRVVSITSKYGREGGGRPWFTMAKSAEMALMKSLALRPELVRDGVTFNSVAPGNIAIPDTGWADEAARDPQAMAALLADTPLGRFGTPEEVASVVLFLCSAQASLVNGASVSVDGGETRSF
jgi:3-oxoacyl-[acyl-carrier protein] reductase